MIMKSAYEYILPIEGSILQALGERFPWVSLKITTKAVKGGVTVSLSYLVEHENKYRGSRITITDKEFTESTSRQKVGIAVKIINQFIEEMHKHLIEKAPQA